MNFMPLRAALLAGAAVLLSGPAGAQETIRIAFIDPLSGLAASTGEAGLKTFQYLAEQLNAKGGVLGKKLAIVTYDKCNFWHFRWDANSDIKMEALTNYMKARTNIKKIYLINQDYSFGQAVRSAARKMLSEKRPDIQIVGDEVHPLDRKSV